MTIQEFYRGKRVFVTGHTGFKGSWLCLWLSEMGAEVTGYALEPPTKPSLFVGARVADLIKSIIGDIRDFDSLKRALYAAEPEIVIHMAAQPLVRLSYKEPVLTYETNVMGTIHILEAMRMLGKVKAFVNVTTDKCYENREWPWGYREIEPMGGYDPYSNSKACSELVTSSYRNSFFNDSEYGKSHGTAIASARAGNVIGGGDWADDRLIPDIVRSLLDKKEILIRNPTSIRPWQYVLEPLSGYLLLAMRLYDKGPEFAEAWNFGPEDNDARSVEWIVEKICRLWGQDASYRIDSGQKPHEANFLKLDISKSKQRLGWTPRWSLDRAIESTLSWTKAMQRGEDIRAESLKQIRSFGEVG